MLWAVSRAPLAKLQAYKRRMGWTFPWASSLNSDFNFDFNVSVSEAQQRKGAYEYNYRRAAGAQSPGGDAPNAPAQAMRYGPAKGAAMTGTDVVRSVMEKAGR